MSARQSGWMAAFSAVAFSVACGQLIGAEFDDLEPLTDASAGVAGDGGTDGDGGTTGIGGANGTSGAGASGGSGGSQATGGSGGTEGTAGSSGNAGSSGSGGSAGTDGSAGSSGTTGSGGTLDGGGTSGTAGTGGSTDGAMGTIVINEIEGRGQLAEDFVELYNPGPGSIDIGGFKVADANNTNVSPKIADAVQFPVPTVVPPGGYVLVLGNQLDFRGPIPCLGFSPCYTWTEGVSSSGERVYLLRADNSEIQHADYPGETTDAGLGNGQSFGRVPNGTGDFTRTSISPAAQNMAVP